MRWAVIAERELASVHGLKRGALYHDRGPQTAMGWVYGEASNLPCEHWLSIHAHVSGEDRHRRHRVPAAIPIRIVGEPSPARTSRIVQVAPVESVGRAESEIAVHQVEHFL